MSKHMLKAFSPRLNESIWEPNNVTGMDTLIKYQEALLESLKAGSKTTINMGEISKMFQKLIKSPSQFYDSVKHFRSTLCN